MVTPAEVSAFLAREFPQNPCLVESLDARGATVRRRVSNADLRPGGTVAGPVLFAVADSALYVALFGALGVITPMAVTSSLNINFLSRPAADRDLRLPEISRNLRRRSLYGGPHRLVAGGAAAAAVPAREPWLRRQIGRLGLSCRKRLGIGGPRRAA